MKNFNFPGVFLKLYRIFIPKYYNDGSEIESDKIKNFSDIIANHFGAYTFNPESVLPLLEGTWMSDNSNAYYTDKIYCIELFCEDTRKNTKWMGNFKTKAEKEFEQEEIFILVQNAEKI